MKILKTVKKHFGIIILMAAYAVLAWEEALAGETKVAIFQLDEHDRTDLGKIQSEFATCIASAITEPGVVSVIDNNLFKNELRNKKGRMTLHEKQLIAERLGADFFLTGSIIAIGNIRRVDFFVVDTQNTKRSTHCFIENLTNGTMSTEISKVANKVKGIIFNQSLLAIYNKKKLCP